MVKFTLNNQPVIYQGDENTTLINYLRLDQHLTATKDGCSGQAVCGACTVEINGKARLACATKMKSLEDATVITMEGIPDNIRDTIAKIFVNQGAVQCGFCTPGFIMRTKILLQNNPNPNYEEIQKAIRGNLCRCTGYKKIEEAIHLSAQALRNNLKVELIKTSGKAGEPQPKYQAYETAIGKRNFVDDLNIDDLLHSALKFSDYPRAKVMSIDISEAKKIPGVVKIFTAKDVPGKRNIGLILDDQWLFVADGEITHYIGEVIAAVVAETEEIARNAVEKIHIRYELLKPVTDVFDALKDQVLVHKGKSNLKDVCAFKRGDIDSEMATAKWLAKGFFETQRIEHAFLETETALAMPEGNEGVMIYSQGQGIYVDQLQISKILGISEDKVRVVLVPNGGGFGGKEDLTVQGYAALFAYILKKPVKTHLTRDESIRVHPKRHPVFMNMEIAADGNGKLIAIRLRAWGDTGAYASVGAKVMERVGGHATGGYYFPNVDIEANTVYTNNIPSGAMRGFGANQVAFALETLIDEICEKAGFDRWKFRYENALTDGLQTATGQKVYQVGIRACLEKLKDKFYQSKYAGLACGIKNSGVGNGMVDFSDAIIEIQSPTKIIIKHGWTEMGQGVHTMAIQTFCTETGLSPDIVEVVVDTNAGIPTGMTTSSRATALLGNAIIDACKRIKNDLLDNTIDKLIGKTYRGQYMCDWTTKPGSDVKEQITHYSYGYAAQLCVLNEAGEIDTFYAAHDAGKIMNPVFFEGQVQGAVHMGIGYALTEDLPMKDGFLISTKLKDCQILRASETPRIVVFGVEVPDAVGPYGVKGIGEIGLVPTAAAVANALYQFDHVRRYKLPMKRK